MPNLSTPASDPEVRFLEYRLHVISDWPPSERKQATLEAVSRRLESIARATLSRGPGQHDLLSLSCHLLDGVFYGGPGA